MKHLLTVVSAFFLLAGTGAGHASAETAPVFVLKWGNDSSMPGPFAYAQGIAVDAAGFVYLTDYGCMCVKKFDGNGNFVSSIGSGGFGPGQFSAIKKVAVDASGNVYVTDFGNEKVVKFGAGGNFLTEWGGPGQGIGKFQYADAIDVGPDNSIYVSDYSRIQRFTPNGEFLSVFAANTSDRVPFGQIAGLTVTPSGKVFAADRINHRIEAFDTSGTYQSQWSCRNPVDLGFRVPNAVDNWGGRLYVASEANWRIQVYDEAGTLLVEWTASVNADHPEETLPRGVAVGPTGNDVYVLFHYQVQKFSYLPVPATPSSWGAMKARYR